MDQADAYRRGYPFGYRVALGPPDNNGPTPLQRNRVAYASDQALPSDLREVVRIHLL